MPVIRPSQGQFIDAASHKTNYHRSGKGKPVILLHGSGPGVSAWQNWGKLFPYLSKRYDAIAPDIAGFGKTELKEGTEYGIKFWVEHMTAILDALHIEKASFVGNSFGGALSMGMAIWQPSRVEKIMLMGTPAGDFTITDGLRSGMEYEPSIEGMRHVLSHFPFNPAVISDEMIEVRYRASIQPGAHEAIRRLMPPPKEGKNAIVKGFPPSLLEKIQCPTLVVHGREDRVVPPTCGQLIFQSVKNADLHMFGNCGHWVQIEKRAAFLELLNDFIDQK
jgi:2-hydroxy-6-oxo-octa-2,4-dienoate hydrolase